MEHDLFVSLEWKTDYFVPIHVNQFKNVTGYVHPSPLDLTIATPIEYFQLYITGNVFQTIVDNTNKYQKYTTRVKRAAEPCYRDILWVDIEMDEMKTSTLDWLFCFVCIINLGTGITGLPTLFLVIQPQKIMTLQRYQKNSEYLHVSDREKERTFPVQQTSQDSVAP